MSKSYMYLPVILCVLFCFSIPFSIYGQVFHTDSSHAEVEGATAMTSYTGVTDQLQGKIDLNEDTVHFRLELTTLKTGISLRDQHMRNALEVEKYPVTSFSGRIVDGEPKPGQTVKTTVKGDYTIHGESKEIEVTGTVKWLGNQLIVNASFPIKITAYGMERPSVMMVTVYDEHDISIEANLHKK